MKILSFLLVMLLSFPVTAIEPYAMPEGKTITVDGVKYQAFTFEEYKTLALIYADYKWVLSTYMLAENQLHLYTNIKQGYDLQLNNCKDMNNTFELDRNYWKEEAKQYKKIAESTKRLNKLERIGYWTLMILGSAGLVFSVSHDALD